MYLVIMFKMLVYIVIVLIHEDIIETNFTIKPLF